ncbi:MAG: glycerol-3-phosphate dehydrogenase [Gemmatimonadetes bacterium]|nr:glycerol-3-phosphate dehydrogenase [Gemmatimonadota bacterium]
MAQKQVRRYAQPNMLRDESITRLSTSAFDLLVIGGGINGAGIARDAALRGLRVALVEQADFASGTSSRSSRLIHGGVRYLEHGQFHLVFESSRERRTLMRIAPHLVRPLAFLWPVYRGARVNRVMLAAALTTYDALALFRNVQPHTRLSAREALTIEPGLLGGEKQILRTAQDDKGLLGAARYYDAATDDSRLTLANIIAAERAGAVVVNHARVESLVRDGARVAGATIRDGESGVLLTARARVVVNATGPWSDAIESMVRTTTAAGVHGSKGVHINVPRERVGNHAALTLLAPQDGRVMFILPAERFTIIGTTDTFDDVAPEHVRATHADVRYLLDSANYFFPGARLTEADVVSAWAGIRPLAAMAGTASGPGSASREHAISETAPGLVRVTGGKLTTYRSMSAQVVDTVQKILGAPIIHSRTANVPLPGGDVADVAGLIAEAALAVGARDVAHRLVFAHGSEWRQVWALVEHDANLGARVAAGAPYIMAEARYAVEHELARTLGDLLIRRMPVAFETRDHGRDAARRIVPLVSRWLGWDDAGGTRALGHYDAEVEQMFTID